MFENNYSSKLLSTAVNEFAKLPGIGRKTALRLVLHLLNYDIDEVKFFGNTIIKLKEEVKRCKICNNISDFEICEICSNPKRNQELVCIVENIKDVIAIENTTQFYGVYHILGGIISPLDGIGPNDLSIDLLEHRLQSGNIKEIVFALSTTMEGETTCFYLNKKLSKYDVTISTIARGVAFGDDLEYTDEMTLGRSIVNRISYNSLNTQKK
jgi:recombination protein RecR